MSAGTSIPLPSFFFGLGKKLESEGWVIGYRVGDDEERPRHTLKARKSKNLVQVTYRQATIDQPEVFSFEASPSTHEEDVRWFNFKDEEDFWEFSHTYDTTLLLNYTPIPPPPSSRVVVAKCRCDKHKFSEKDAHESLLNAKIKRHLRGKKKRRECRVYPCPTQLDVFHLTSLEEWVPAPTHTKVKHEAVDGTA